MRIEVDNPGSGRTGGANPASSPAGLDEFERETTPVNPPNGVRVIVELLEPPTKTSRKNGLAEIVKPGPNTVTSMSTK